MSRISWDKYFLRIAIQVASRSTCLHRQVGAVLVDDTHHIISTGYNGAPSGLIHCTTRGVCHKEKMGYGQGVDTECRGVHAEVNAIIQAAKQGVSTQGSTLYCTVAPCTGCSKMLINAGIKRVVYLGNYPDGLGRKMMRDAQILVQSKEDIGILESLGATEIVSEEKD